MKWRRRSLLSGLAALPVLAWTQTGRSVRVGVLGATTATGFGSHWAAFKKVQLELGVAFAAVDVFLRINGWRLRHPPTQMHAEMIQMFDAGTFDLSHLDPWLRGFASPHDH
jgi:hypothetical protein